MGHMGGDGLGPRVGEQCGQSGGTGGQGRRRSPWSPAWRERGWKGGRGVTVRLEREVRPGMRLGREPASHSQAKGGFLQPVLVLGSGLVPPREPGTVSGNQSPRAENFGLGPHGRRTQASTERLPRPVSLCPLRGWAPRTSRVFPDPTHFVILGICFLQTTPHHHPQLPRGLKVMGRPERTLTVAAWAGTSGLSVWEPSVGGPCVQSVTRAGGGG